MTRTRISGGRTLELLAPAGTMAILEALVDSGADAFYAGGKGLNMRLHRRDYNFSDDELIAAAALCRAKGLKLYVTVNKLMGDEDLSAAPGYLEFLARDVRPDAIIVQDLAVSAIVAELRLPLAMHASVMMNANNADGIEALAGLGFSRVVLSRESSFADARRIFDATSMELEYFAHGDMCAARGSQCLYSGMLFGLSSNRGLCMKPCRWPFSASVGDRRYGKGFPLAVRDLCLYRDLEAAAKAGISSFKIEGRMRGADYLKRIIAAYSGALDKLVDPAASYDLDAGYASLFDNRLRDFTTAFAYGKPGASMLNARWEGTGKFYSTGKVFSVAAAEPESDTEAVARITSILEAGPRREATLVAKTQLAIRVDSVASAVAAFRSGADVAILSGEPFSGASIATVAELTALRLSYPGKRVCLALPRMLEDGELPDWERIVAERAGLFDELYVGQLGAERRFGALASRLGIPMSLAGDSSLNALNAKAAESWAARGLSSICASAEIGPADLVALVARSPIPVELIVHGRPSSMYIGLDMAACVRTLSPITTEASDEESTDGASSESVSPFGADAIVLFDERGSSHPVLKDSRGEYHLLSGKALALLPLVPALSRLGVARLRIEGALYDSEALGAICAAYRAVIDGAAPDSVTMPAEVEGAWLGSLGSGAR